MSMTGFGFPFGRHSASRSLPAPSRLNCMQDEASTISRVRSINTCQIQCLLTCLRPCYLHQTLRATGASYHDVLVGEIWWELQERKGDTATTTWRRIVFTQMWQWGGSTFGFVLFYIRIEDVQLSVYSKGIQPNVVQVSYIFISKLSTC